MYYLTFLFLIVFTESCYAKENDIFKGQCRDKCTTSDFSLEEFNACVTGCKIFSKSISGSSKSEDEIFEFGLQIPSVITQCYSSCNGAYPAGEKRFACKFGCSAAESIVIDQEAEAEFKNMRKFALESLHPLLKWMQTSLSNKEDNLGIDKTVSMTTVILKDDDEVFSIRLPGDSFHILPFSKVSSEAQESSQLETPSNESEQSSSFKDLLARAKVYARKVSLRCRKPDMLMMLLFVTTGLILIYWVLAALSSGRKKIKILRKKRAITIPKTVLPSKLVRPEDLTKLSLIDDDDYQNQPPQPTKVKLPDHAIV